MAEYIERRAAHDAVVDAIWHGKRSMYSVANAINSVTSADVAPVRHGKWIDRYDNDTHMHECSVCRSRVVKGFYEYQNPNLYCYHCGAKMDGDMENYRPAEVIR